MNFPEYNKTLRPLWALANEMNGRDKKNISHAEAEKGNIGMMEWWNVGGGRKDKGERKKVNQAQSSKLKAKSE